MSNNIKEFKKEVNERVDKMIYDVNLYEKFISEIKKSDRGK